MPTFLTQLGHRGQNSFSSLFEETTGHWLLGTNRVRSIPSEAPPQQPSVRVQTDRDDEIPESDRVSHRDGKLSFQAPVGQTRHRPNGSPVLKLWRRSAVAALPR